MQPYATLRKNSSYNHLERGRIYPILFRRTDLILAQATMKFLALLFFTFVAAIGRNAVRRKVVMEKLCNARTCGMCGEVLHAGARLFAEPTKRARNLCYALRSFQGCCN